MTSARPVADLAFVNGISGRVGHEIAEQMVDRNGSDPHGEVGDPCNGDYFTYRSWQVQKYWSDWDNICIRGDQPPPMPRSFQAVNNYSRFFVLETTGTSG